MLKKLKSLLWKKTRKPIFTWTNADIGHLVRGLAQHLVDTKGYQESVVTASAMLLADIVNEQEGTKMVLTFALTYEGKEAGEWEIVVRRTDLEAASTNLAIQPSNQPVLIEK
jgi:hypothetical protein